VLLHQYIDADAPAQGQAHVLLRPLPELRCAQRLLSRRQVQQEQHRAAGQVVQQLPVSIFTGFILFRHKCGVEFEQKYIYFDATWHIICLSVIHHYR